MLFTQGIAARGKRAEALSKPRPDLRPMSGLSSGLVSDCPPQRQHVAAGRAARRLLHEIFRSIAARNADCERGSASEDSQSCSRHSPPKGARGRALSTDARYTAAHLARRSYTADHLAGTLRAQPLLGRDAWGWCWMNRASKAEAWPDRWRRDRPRKVPGARKARKVRVPRLGYGEACCPARSAPSSTRARTLRARV